MAAGKDTLLGTSCFRSPDYWLQRAEEVLAVMEQMQHEDPEPRRLMNDIAQSYVQLARHAARRQNEAMDALLPRCASTERRPFRERIEP